MVENEASFVCIVPLDAKFEYELHILFVLESGLYVGYVFQRGAKHIFDSSDGYESPLQLIQSIDPETFKFKAVRDE